MGNEWETIAKRSMAINKRKHTLKCEYVFLPHKRFAFRTKVSHKGRNRAINKGVSTAQYPGIEGRIDTVVLTRPYRGIVSTIPGY